jgi:hypothetical protein
MSTTDQTQYLQLGQMLSILAPLNGEDQFFHVLATNDAVLTAVFKAPGYSKEAFKNKTVQEVREIYVGLQHDDQERIAGVLKDWADFRLIQINNDEQKTIAQLLLSFPLGTPSATVIAHLDSEHPDFSVTDAMSRLQRAEVTFDTPRFGKMDRPWYQTEITGMKSLLWKKSTLSFQFDPASGVIIFPEECPVDLTEQWDFALKNKPFICDGKTYFMERKWYGWIATPADAFNARNDYKQTWPNVIRDPESRLFTWESKGGELAAGRFICEDDAYKAFYAAHGGK